MRFAYITDTHLGGTEESWGQQPTYAKLVPELFGDLSEYVRRERVDFILHGGDVTDGGTVEQQEQLVEIISGLPCRFYLTLGNHDLAQKDSLKRWYGYGESVFGSGVTESCDFSIDVGGVKLIVMTNTWQKPESENAFYWDKEAGQEAGFTQGQYEWLEKELGDCKFAILSIHETLYPLGTELTGMDSPIHEPPGEYVKDIRSFIDSHSNIKLVLSGHCHASCRTKDGDTVHLTSAAYFEPPFQVRLVDVVDDSIEVTVGYPVDLKKYSVEINEERMWSAGKWYDWRVSVPL